MITKYQAEAIVKATHYRDWTIELVSPAQMALWGLMGLIKAELDHALPVMITYKAPDSRPGVEGEVTNQTPLSVPLTETEEQFARALFEAIGLIEEHERREFFTVDLDVVKDRPFERHVSSDQRGWNTARSGGQKEALFHPHGINRNKLFHDLDPFAKGLKIKDLSGAEFISDAV